MSLTRALAWQVLGRRLEQVNRRRADRCTERSAALELAFQLVFRADERLAVYGTLAPGRENHHLLARMKGEWSNGYVQGELVPLGWGAVAGYPALRWNPAASRVSAWVLHSHDLPARWAELDAFEGRDYYRALVPVCDAGGRFLCLANLYAVT